MRVTVTGGSGRAGTYIIPELIANGHLVLNADRVPLKNSAAQFMRIDVTDFNDTLTALSGADAVIHLAAIPNPRQDAERRVFETNITGNWNVLEAAEILNIEKIVMASSINAIGADFSHGVVPLEYFPIDEKHPTRVEDAYSQSKWLGEQMADAFCRRRTVQISSMRFHALWDEEMSRVHKIRCHESDSQSTGSPQLAIDRGAMGFWGWVDRRDAARACRFAIERSWHGHEVFFINSNETNITVPTEEAIASTYPGVPLRRELPGFISPIDTSKAERILGWKPVHSWRH